MTSAFSSAGDRSSRFPGGDMALQNLKSLYAESPDLPIFTRAVSPCPPTAAASKTSAARTFAPITAVSYGNYIHYYPEHRSCSQPAGCAVIGVVAPTLDHFTSAALPRTCIRAAI